MTYINNWDDTVDANSCIGFDIWNDMIDSISCPSSAKTDFYIYSDCLNRTTPKFKFTYDDDNSIMYGAATTTSDLILQANEADSYPYILLNGKGSIILNSYSYTLMEYQNTQTFKFDFSGSESSLYGGENTGDDLTIYANTTDSSPSITLNGDSEIHLKVKADEEILFLQNLKQFFKFDHSGDDSLLYGGSTANDDLNIYSNSSDAYPVIELFGASNINLAAHVNVLISVQNETAFTFALSTDESILYGSDDASDDLTIRANSSDSTPSISLLGGAEIQLKVKANEEIIFLQDGSQFFKFDSADDDSMFYGGSDANDDLIIFANSTDSTPSLTLEGNANAIINVDTSDEIIFKENNLQIFKFSKTDDDSILHGGSSANDDLILKANASDNFSYILLGGADDIIINSHADIYIKEKNAQILKFSLVGTDSIISGGSNTGNDITIFANSNDSSPSITLLGDGAIHLKVKSDEEIVLMQDDSQFFKFDHSAIGSLFYGGIDTGDDITIFANSTDSTPSLSLLGDGEIQLKVKADGEISFLQDSLQFFKFDNSGDDSFLYGGESASDDLIIRANSSDGYPLIELAGASDLILNANADTYIKIQNAQLFKFNISGVISQLFGGSDAGDDLAIYANSNESCAKMLLYGNGDAIISPYHTGIFEISTCSGEKLFEVSAPSQSINHRCMQAMNFRVECLTADPSGVTCQGRMWLRTDLV